MAAHSGQPGQSPQPGWEPEPGAPLAPRVSDWERERTVGTLRERSAQGYLSADTFAGRVERALGARRHSELADLVSDLPPRGRVAQLLLDAVGRLSALTLQLEHAWKAPRRPRLPLPDTAGQPLTIGRDPGCDFVLQDSSVSRRHARVLREDGCWRLLDLNSTNGTRVNGVRQPGLAAVRPGDQVTFGRVSLYVSAA